MRLYLAGPMTGYPLWNFDTFADGAALLRAHGYDVWSPHERDLEKGFDPSSDGSGFDLQAALLDDVEAVLGSDGLALLPGWEGSPGVAVEILTAEGAGIPWAPIAEWLAPAAPAAVEEPTLARVIRFATVILFPVTTAVALLDPLAWAS